MTVGEVTPSRRLSPPGDSCDPPANLSISCIRMTYWTSSMETPPHSSQEEERLKSEIAILLARIRILETEIQRLRDKLASTWGSW